MLEREEEATACAQGWKGVDRNVRLGEATHSEVLPPPSRCSALCPPAPPPVMPLTAKRGCYRCYRCYRTCTGRIPTVWPGCRLGWLVSASPASATAPPATAGQAVSVCKTAEARGPQTVGRGLDAECCCAALPRLAAQGLHLCVGAPARASRVANACMAGANAATPEARA
jgi:hypothetical protein